MRDGCSGSQIPRDGTRAKAGLAVLQERHNWHRLAAGKWDGEVIAEKRLKA